jgi:hypothetical protein
MKCEALRGRCIRAASVVVIKQLSFAFKATWPSGLRRQTKDLVRKGVGSSPTVVIQFYLLAEG